MSWNLSDEMDLIAETGDVADAKALAKRLDVPAACDVYRCIKGGELDRVALHNLAGATRIQAQRDHRFLMTVVRGMRADGFPI